MDTKSTDHDYTQHVPLVHVLLALPPLQQTLCLPLPDQPKYIWSDNQYMLLSISLHVRTSKLLRRIGISIMKITQRM